MKIALCFKYFDCYVLLEFSFHQILHFFSDFTRGPYGKGLYFSMQASQAASFSAVKYFFLVFSKIAFVKK